MQMRCRSWYDRLTPFLNRVVNVLRSWITDYLYDDEEGILLDQISAFAATMNSDISGQLMKLIERRVSLHEWRACYKFHNDVELSRHLLAAYHRYATTFDGINVCR